MCGIISKVGKPFNLVELIKIYSTMKEGGEGFSQRGTDSFGLFALNTDSGKYCTMKYCSIGDDDLVEFIGEVSSINYDQLASKYNLFIYHNRWASIGKKTDLNLAHPIIEEDWIVLHNGTKQGANIFDTDSDTQGFAKYLLYKGKLRDVSLRDSGVLFAYNKKEKKIYLHKDSSRSLFATSDMKILSSEPLHFISKNWSMVLNNKSLIPFEDVKAITNEDIKFLTSLPKHSPIRSNECCLKKSSNAVLLDGENICYNCISEFDCNLKDIRVGLNELNKVSNLYVNDVYGRGGYYENNTPPASYKRGK